MKDLSNDPKQKAILEAAWQAFATYGFRKTSMDDIARGAGMSRPAVYLHYKGKEEIFRSLVQHYYDEAVTNVAAALDAGSSPRDSLAAAFQAQAGESMRAMLQSPHGLELLDTGAATAGDIKETGEARLQGIYANWLTQAAGLVVTDDPEAVAATICAALKGIKDAGTDYDTYCARQQTLAHLIADGLVPR